MSEISRAVVDASIMLKLFLPEQRSDKAHELWASWVHNSTEVVAPTLIMFEVSSVIRNKIHRGLLNETDGAEIIEHMKRIDLRLVYTEDLLEVAWDIGRSLEMPVLYDCFYLSLSQLLDAPIWTADAKLFQKAKGLIPRLNLL